MDYSRIRGMESGQRLAFEELICQLGRRDKPAAKAEFRRVEGAGGDGGLEAYWLLDDDKKVGYQAKYYLKSSDINWANIDDSVEKALRSHPSLKKYIVAIPCDLTDKSGPKGGGKRGWDHWETHKEKWEKLVPAGQHVEFTLWSASDITDRLSNPNAEGLKKYWFGDFEFSPQWFANNVGFAIQSLDERYHPDDHVEVSIEKLFKVILCDHTIIEDIQKRISKVCRLAKINDPENILGSSERNALDIIATTAKALEILSSRYSPDAWLEWPIQECLDCVDDMSDAIHPLENLIWSLKEAENKPKQSSDYKLSNLEHQLREASSACYSLRSLLRDRYISKQHESSILLNGKAGTGKSHLLGSVAQEAICEGRTAVLILGQHLGGENVWGQITRRLGLGDLNPDVFLQALSAAAEATKRRGLILIDAVNEGGGLALWRNELAEFIARIEKHKNLVLVFSCRYEYTSYIIPPKLSNKIPSFMVQGFRTPEEQKRAARVYLGKRGISQPNTPWLAEEFTNPLFLRSACVALERDNKKFFPKGLIGTKQVFAFYLRSIARNLGAGRDGSDDLVSPTMQSIVAIALDMAGQRRDYVPHSQAIALIAEKFQAYPTPPATTWFEILQRNGLFRLDPDPHSLKADPFLMAEELTRFSFQRLQDHLMASALLDNVENPALALASGSLQFIHNGERILGEWAGLTEALSIQIPELFNEELLDLMPGDTDHWANDYSVGGAFIESLKWRSNESFTDRTLHLYNAFLNASAEHFDIILQVSASVGHPWNAKFLHERLKARKMPQRDAFWSVQVNGLSLEEGSTIHRLIEWSAFEQNNQTDPEVQYLCALTLTWFFSSSNRLIRDRASKALTSLMIINPGLYDKLCNDFAAVDDLYVQERLHTAAYGACCIDGNEQRLQSYSDTAYRIVFGSDVVPLSILLRDAALGIIEMATLKNCLSQSVDVQKCSPPYRTKMIRLSITEEALERASKAVGGSNILSSCTGWMGDFASYEIQPRVSTFLNVSLTDPEPMSDAEIRDRFKEEVIEICPVRSALLKRMRKITHNKFRTLLVRLEHNNKKDEIKDPDHSEEFKRLEKQLLTSLNKEEKARYRKEYQPYFNSSNNRPDRLPHIDIKAAQRWIAKRAYGLGWTNKLFPDDRSHGEDHSRSRPLIERIGKKYQWLALDELLCSLADNKWMSERRSNGSRLYATPLDIGFHRDIDPTILLIEDEAQAISQGVEFDKCEISLRETEEEELGMWPFEDSPAINIPRLVTRTDSTGAEWIVLHEHRNSTDRYSDKANRDHGLRKQEWRFLLPVFVRSEDKALLLDYTLDKKNINVDSWTTRDLTDAGFLREAPWRSTWEQAQWSSQYFHDLGEVDIAYPSFFYQWESHLDASLPQGAQAILPAPWLAHRLGLTPHRENADQYVDQAGAVRFASGRSPGDGSHAYMDKQLVEAFLEEEKLECIWVFVAERSAWPGGENDHASRRRSEGVIWREDGKMKMVSWDDDWARGDSLKYLPIGA